MKQSLRLVIIMATLLMVALGSAALVWSRSGRSPDRETQPLSLPAPPLISDAELDTLLAPDAIIAIDDPQFKPVNQVQDMANEERVIAVEINGDARAYPLHILSTHEIVNDNVGGEPVAVTWCPLCYSALVFSSQVEDRRLTFGVSGKLLQNTQYV